MRNISKLAGVAGIGWAASNTLLGFSTGQPPEIDASGEEIRTYLADGRGVYLAAAAVFAATLPLLFVFTAELGHRVRVAGHRLAASVMQPAITTLVFGTTLAYLLLLPFILGDGLGSDASDGLVRYAYLSTFVVSMIGNIGGAVLLAAVSTAQQGRARLATRALATVVAVVAVGGLVIPTLTVIGGLGLLAIAVWSVVVGIGMMRESVGMTHAALAAA